LLLPSFSVQVHERLHVCSSTQGSMERGRTGCLVYHGGCLEWNRSGPFIISFPSFPPRADPCMLFRLSFQITHIQFLTLLYPSELEARLIFGLLGSFSSFPPLSLALLLGSADPSHLPLFHPRPHRPSLLRHDLHLPLLRINSSMGNDRSKHLQLSSLPPLHHRSLPLGVRRQSQQSLENGWRNGCVRSGCVGVGCFEYGGELFGGQGECLAELKEGGRKERERELIERFLGCFWLGLTGR